MKRKAIESELAMLNERTAKLRAIEMPHLAAPVIQEPLPLPHPTGCEGADVELRRVMDNFVDLYEKLDTCNDVNIKPNYSYTELAYLAMLRSPNFCLPITEIYRYMKTRFLFFKNSTRKHWKNAIRHSLAKTLCFTKIAVGRGTSNTKGLSRSTYLWCIIPSSIISFARGDYRPSVDRDSGTNTLRWGYYRVNAGQFWDQVGNFMAAKMSTFKRMLEISQDPAQIFEAQTCTLSPSADTHVTSSPIQQVPFRKEEASPQPIMTSYECNVTPPTPHLRFDSPPQMTSPVSNITYVAVPQMATFDHCPSTMRSPEPANDPFLSKTVIISPNTSASSFESDRRTPPFCSFDGRDSGNDTLGSDYSPSENSSFQRNFSSCRLQQNSGQLSPACSGATSFHFPDEQELQQLELSPLGGTELQTFHNNVAPYSYSLMEDSQNCISNQGHYEMPYHAQQFMYQQCYAEQSCVYGMSTPLSPVYHGNGKGHLHSGAMPNWTT